jgi:pilus assembly protein TadC
VAWPDPVRCAEWLPVLWFAAVLLLGAARLAPRSRAPVGRPAPGGAVPGRLLRAAGGRVRRVTGIGTADGDAARGATLAAVLVLGLLAPPLAVLPPAVSGARWVRRRRRARVVADTALWQELPEAAELLAIAVGAGCNPLGAVEAAACRLDGPVGVALGAAVQRVRAGERLDDALGVAADRLGDPAGPLLDALRAGERYGTPLVPGLRRCGVELRAARRRRAEEQARRVPVRLLLPLCGCVLPAFVLLTFVPLLAGGIGSLDLGG